MVVNCYAAFASASRSNSTCAFHCFTNLDCSVCDRHSTWWLPASNQSVNIHLIEIRSQTLQDRLQALKSTLCVSKYSLFKGNYMSLKTLSLPVLATLLIIGLSACEKKGPAEVAGEKIDNAAEKMGDKIEDATDKAGDKLESAGDKIEDKTD